MKKLVKPTKKRVAVVMNGESNTLWCY